LITCKSHKRYIQGAASPKDVVILLDSSGSMTGLRREIAKNVVSNILDTLTDDDYVSSIKVTNYFF
jgi:voltage-dependent calcium channel alpha-2/delta-3